ncbi:MAG: site-specific integrase [Acidimicrobiales bacterium]
MAKTFHGGKRAVRTAANAWERQLRATPSSAVGTTVAALLEMWQDAKRTDWQPTTIRDVRGRCARIAAELGYVRLIDLDPIQVDAWLIGMRRDGVGEGAIRGRVQTLRSALSWGVSRRLLRSNPVSDARPRVATGRRSRRPESDQVVALIAAATAESSRAGLALRVAAVTGARAAEVVALRWDDLAGDRLLIGRQRHSYGGVALIREQTKTGGSRRVVLDAGTVAAIRERHAEADALVGAPTDWMLAEAGAAEPPSPRWLYDVFVRAAAVAGVPTGRNRGLVLHDLRHWAASTALKDGHDPVTVAARLGHSPEMLLRIYAQEIDDGQVDVAASLASRLDG